MRYIKKTIISCFVFALFFGCKKKEDCGVVSVLSPIANFIGLSDYGQFLKLYMTHQEESLGLEYFWETPWGEIVPGSEYHILDFDSTHQGTYYAYVKKGECTSPKKAVLIQRGHVEPPCDPAPNVAGMEGHSTLNKIVYTKTTYSIGVTTSKVTAENSDFTKKMTIDITGGGELRPGVYPIHNPDGNTPGSDQPYAKIIFTNGVYGNYKGDLLYVTKKNDEFELITCGIPFKNSLNNTTYPFTMKLVVK